MDKRVGFVGVGNMGGAILKGLLSSGLVSANTIYVREHNEQKTAEVAKEFGVNGVSTVEQLATQTDILIVGVKPNVIKTVLKEIAPYLSEHTIIVSIAAGVTLEQLAMIVGAEKKIVRSMPNTPALVGAGISSLTPNLQVTEQELGWIKAIFSSFGTAEIVPEYLIHAVVGVSGSSPAYVFMLIEAMADAAVLGGMPRQQAYTFAAQAVLGSAKMVLETGMHPGHLKDMVCSPAGTTIEAVRTLEDKGFRSAVIEAMQRCMDKSITMSKQ